MPLCMELYITSNDKGADGLVCGIPIEHLEMYIFEGRGYQP